ncbi:glycosyltransferase family 2 protein [Paenibacillus sp. P96]|uniref:Glycosyltransferase family 2 protein n=1 Tax=Paenibacillus zeirhizosphaerae TaxID=2987519 RepID=A0ABT9FY79_9BACL|nr:glycosyltransferase family 2 protein [Paenibacillus sp. P96]MDP4099417.1 glycosyltransferase family 2 protein [Paenibacillus sp. P96]
MILTRNQMALTQACLDSIRRHTREPYELILVDNGSTDGTLDYLRSQPDVILIENGENKGFAKGCNQGFERSNGDYIMFLNNDTVVTENWMTHLLRALNEDPRIGMVGPVTNYSSGHQQISVGYTTMEGLESFSRQHQEIYAGIYNEVRRLVGFCLLTKRAVLEEVGLFDEIYGLGNYEDDDLSLRMLRSGYGMRVVLDSFIHHVGHATTQNELPDSNLSLLLQRNAAIATQKWGGNIHQIIYKPVLSVAGCLVVMNAENILRDTLASLTNDFEKIIVVDVGSTDATSEIARSYPIEFHSITEVNDKLHNTYSVFEEMKSEYVLWLYQGDVLSDKDVRLVRAMKFAAEGEPDMIAVDFGEGLNKNEYLAPIARRYLIKRDLAARKLSTVLFGITVETTS